MIEMTYKDISDQRFFEALSKLNRQPLPVKTAYAIKKLSDDILRARKNISAEFTTIAEKYAAKNEKGEMAMGPGGTPEIPEDLRAKFNEEEAAFSTKMVKLERPKIPLETLSGCTMTAIDLKFLEPVVAELVAVD